MESENATINEIEKTTTGNGTWQVFLRNKVAVASLAIIVISFLLAIFAYFVIPDQSPNANNQFPMIALKAPGFSSPSIKVANLSTSDNKQGFFDKLINGKDLPYKLRVYQNLEYQDAGIMLTNHYQRQEFIPYKDLFFEFDSGSKNSITKAYVESRKDDFLSTERFYLGTDKFGRDILSRLILGIRVSILVGLVAVAISLFVGILVGATSGYFGGKIDQLLMLLINVSWSIPTLLMVFAIVLAFDRGISVIFIAVGLTMWVEVARIVRGQVRSIKEEQFVMAAKSMGFGHFKIIIQHILPNIIGPILVIAAANFSTAVLVEAGLSYLGFGVEPPTPSIGNMLNEHYGYALTGKVFLATIPAITLMILVLSFNLVGSGLRDAFDVKRQDS
jgi:peptide/nickel transport system permease protein